MKSLIILFFLAAIASPNTYSQDTSSIVAVDPATGEVGSAGASCVDLFQAGLPNDAFLGQLIPGVGAINTQAYYIPANQTNATNRMNLGETPSQIINWLVANDVNSQPQLRQYGIAAFVNGSPETAAHTGASTDNYKNHITGPNYSIQGNILLSQAVLDSMEARFLRETGDLACKLMAAMQGANMIGADTRCSANGTSSLFAFVKTAKPSDTFGSPSFQVSVRTANNAGIEPIDSLQSKFDLAHSCTALGIKPATEQLFSIYPNPSSGFLTIQNKTEEVYDLYLCDIFGKLILQTSLGKTQVIDVSEFESGMYFLKIANEGSVFSRKLVVE